MTDQPLVVPKEKKEKKVQLVQDVEDESQVIVHCTSKAQTQDIMIRIWKTIYLIPKEISHKSGLVHHENISLAPQWTPVPKGKTHKFTLIFSGLPKGCKSFDIVEEIPQPGAFVRRNIQRNKKDVYHIDFNE